MAEMVLWLCLTLTTVLHQGHTAGVQVLRVLETDVKLIQPIGDYLYTVSYGLTREVGDKVNFFFLSREGYYFGFNQEIIHDIRNVIGDEDKVYVSGRNMTTNVYQLWEANHSQPTYPVVFTPIKYQPVDVKGIVAFSTSESALLLFLKNQPSVLLNNSGEFPFNSFESDVSIMKEDTTKNILYYATARGKAGLMEKSPIFGLPQGRNFYGVFGVSDIQITKNGQVLYATSNGIVTIEYKSNGYVAKSILRNETIYKIEIMAGTYVFAITEYDVYMVDVPFNQVTVLQGWKHTQEEVINRNYIISTAASAEFVYFATSYSEVYQFHLDDSPNVQLMTAHTIPSGTRIQEIVYIHNNKVLVALTDQYIYVFHTKLQTSEQDVDPTDVIDIGTGKKLWAIHKDELHVTSAKTIYKLFF